MTDATAPTPDAGVDSERSALRAIAFRMLGTVADADDAVQEAYVRWLRLPPGERAEVRSPGAWLTRAVGRICLDMLTSARARRELYVGEWLPEPLPSTDRIVADPAVRAEFDDTVSTALLIVAETLTPAERVAFVLHDVFALGFGEIAEILGRSPAAARQLAASARRRLRDRPDEAPNRRPHDRLVEAFAAACASGRLDALLAVLAPDVVLRSDGGGVVSAARRPVVGAERVARFLLGLAAKHPDAVFEPVRTADGLAFAVRLGGMLHSVWNLGARGDGVEAVWIVANPAKLTRWR